MRLNWSYNKQLHLSKSLFSASVTSHRVRNLQKRNLLNFPSKTLSVKCKWSWKKKEIYKCAQASNFRLRGWQNLSMKYWQQPRLHAKISSHSVDEWCARRPHCLQRHIGQIKCTSQGKILVYHNTKKCLKILRTFSKFHSQVWWAI